MGTVVGSWRLKIMLLLIITVVAMYTVNSLFASVPTDKYGYVRPNKSFDYEADEGNTFTDNIYNLWEFLTFGNIDNSWCQFVLLFFATICYIIIAYIIYTFIKEWIPLT